MKKYKSVRAVIVAITILCLTISMYGETILALRGKVYVSENKTALMGSEVIKVSEAFYEKGDLSFDEPMELNVAPSSVEVVPIVYDNMTLEQLADKLNRVLHSTISGQGYAFASMAIEYGIDPYLAVAIVMHETGCKWECSSLLRQCNNVGGMKGSTSCNGGAYASFPTLEDGIRAYMDNLYKNYVSQGLTTAEAMGPKYAASSTWASQVNSYINEIKAA